MQGASRLARMPTDKLLLLDSASLYFRAFFGVKDLREARLRWPLVNQKTDRFTEISAAYQVPGPLTAVSCERQDEQEQGGRFGGHRDGEGGASAQASHGVAAHRAAHARHPDHAEEEAAFGGGKAARGGQVVARLDPAEAGIVSLHGGEGSGRERGSAGRGADAAERAATDLGTLAHGSHLRGEGDSY